MSRKRAISDFFPPTEAPSAKRAPRGVVARTSDIDDERWSEVSSSANINKEWKRFMNESETAFSYVCLCEHWFVGSSGDQGDSDEDEDEDDEDNQNLAGCKENCLCKKPANEHPEHNWVITEAGLRKFTSIRLQLGLRSPSAFNLYTFNDHEAYGALEVVEGLVRDFSEEKHDWRAQWAVCEALALFLISEQAFIMCTVDDGQAILELYNLICGMFGSMIARLEREGLVGPDSEVKNLAQIMALYYRIGSDEDGLMEMGFSSTQRNRHIATMTFAYSKKHDIVLRSPISLNPETLSHFGVFAQNFHIPAPETRNNDPWDWTKALNDYKNAFQRPGYAFCPGPIGADRFDITTWTSAKRKKHNVQGKDPISPAKINEIKNGKILGQR